MPLRITGRTGLDSPLPVGALALGAVAAQLLAARALDDSPLDLDAVHVGMAMRSERWVRLDGRPVGLGFAPLSRFWRTADGWLRLHGNYPHHRAAAIRVLGEDVESAAARWKAEELETAVVEAGGAAAAVRTAEDLAGAAAGRRRRGVAAADASSARPTAAPSGCTPRPAGARPDPGDRRAGRDAHARRRTAPTCCGSTAPGCPTIRDALLDTGSGKRHVTVDLGASAGRRTVEELLASADVLVQGYRPGALDAFGLDPGALAERHPHLVVVRLSAWGLAGPWRQRRGFDSLVQAATGIAAICGSAAEPGVLPAQALDHATGHLAAAVVLAALARQRDEGGGWHGELSLAQTAHWLLTAPRSARSRPGRRIRAAI